MLDLIFIVTTAVFFAVGLGCRGLRPAAVNTGGTVSWTGY